MSIRWKDQKAEIAEAARRLAELGLVAGSSGNVSVRLPAEDDRELMAITPMGRPYDSLQAEDVVVLDHEMEAVEGDAAPSSESLLHVAVYRRRPEVGAVIHTHAVYSSVAAVVGLEIPPIIDEMVVAVGGAIRVSKYAFPGSMELADNVCEALGERNAALMGNHGAVGVGRDLGEAVDVCSLTERAAQIFVLSSLLGKAGVLPKEVVDAEAAIFRMRSGVRNTGTE